MGDRAGKVRTIGLRHGIGRKWHRSFLVIARQELPGLRRLSRLWRNVRVVALLFALSAVGTYIKPAKKTKSKYILCDHDMRSFTTIGMGNASMRASATKSRPPIANVSLP